jgi:hypothetical protein
LLFGGGLQTFPSWFQSLPKLHEGQLSPVHYTLQGSTARILKEIVCKLMANWLGLVTSSRQQNNLSRCFRGRRFSSLQAHILEVSALAGVQVLEVFPDTIHAFLLPFLHFIFRMRRMQLYRVTVSA